MNELVASMFVVVAELALVFAAGLAVAVFYIVRVLGGERKAAQALIAGLRESEAERQTARIAALRDKYSLDENVARDCAARLLELEKGLYGKLANAVAGRGGQAGALVEELNRLLIVAMTVAGDHVKGDVAAQDDAALDQLKQQNQALNEENERLADEVTSLKQEIDKVIAEYTQMYDRGKGDVSAAEDS